LVPHRKPALRRAFARAHRALDGPHGGRGRLEPFRTGRTALRAALRRSEPRPAPAVGKNQIMQGCAARLNMSWPEWP
jgi:hypothetical protein